MSFEIKYNVDGTPQHIPMPTEMEAAANAATEQVEATQEAAADESEENLTDSSVDSGIDINEPEEPVEAAPQPVQPKKKVAKEDNFEEMRKKVKQAERRARELEEQLAANEAKKAEVPEEDLSYHIEEDALVEGKHLSKVDKKIQRLENKLKQYEQQSSLSATELRLKQQYSDFDFVVSADNLSKLAAEHPEIMQSINSNQDLYSKASSAYKLIKSLGIIEPVDVYQADKEQAQRNAAKPKALASIAPQKGDSPLSRANAFAQGALSDDMKAQLIREMHEARKGY